ncbi:MAG TPA: acyltransferase [Limnobacter sp.]|nr:acyltransferase [Limnobacter sp.]
MNNHAIAAPHASAQRIAQLDGLRGLAILLVLLFHTYSRWPDHLPWVTVHRDFHLFKYGFLGVELFFLISGYVIYMTLEKCSSMREFMLRRWLRLFPAMLIASIAIYATSFYLTERPKGPVQLADLLPGLLFVEERWLNKMHNFSDLDAIEGAFWSLFVEVKFYLVFGAFYFFDKRTALRNLIALFLLAFVYETMRKLTPAYTADVVTDVLFGLLSLKYFGWFCVGALMFKARQSGNTKLLCLSLFMMVPTILIMYGRDPTIVTACMLVYAVFYLALNNIPIGRLFTSRIFVFLGFVSYPLYLIHENAMVAMTIKTNQFFANMPPLLTPLPGILLIVLIAYAMAKHLEPWMRAMLQKHLFARVQIQAS